MIILKGVDKMEQISLSKAQDLFNDGIKIYAEPSEFWKEQGYSGIEPFCNKESFAQNVKYFKDTWFVHKVSLGYLTNYTRYTTNPKKEIVFVEKPIYIYRDRPKKQKKSKVIQPSLF
jgi:hypothetical protein